MKMQDAMAEINKKSKGFMVAFEWCGDGFSRSDNFPDKHAGEDLIPSEAEAWSLAFRFAEATKGRTANIYVTDDNYRPVKGYKSLKIANR